MAKVEGNLYDTYSIEKFGHILDRYKRMVKEIYQIEEEDFMSNTRGNGTLSFRYARIIYTYICYIKGVTHYAIGLGLNRTADTVGYNLRCHKSLLKTDDYYRHMLEMAIEWDKNN